MADSLTTYSPLLQKEINKWKCAELQNTSSFQLLVLLERPEFVIRTKRGTVSNNVRILTLVFFPK
jgi:hypothetical protein